MGAGSLPDDDALRLGGAAFYGVPFPLAVGDRYIHLRIDAGDPVCQIWRWDAGAGRAVREPDPGDGGGGVVLVAEPEGRLELRFAPSGGNGQLSGLAAFEDLRVVVEPDEMRIHRGDRLEMTMRGAQIQGSDVGIRIDENGTAIGGRLPAGFQFQIDYVNRRVQLARLVPSAEFPVVANARFVHCRIEGPAVLAGDGLSIRDSTWYMLGAAEESQYVTVPDPMRPYGAVIMRNVDIDNCDLINIALAK